MLKMLLKIKHDPCLQREKLPFVKDFIVMENIAFSD